MRHRSAAIFFPSAKSLEFLTGIITASTVAIDRWKRSSL